MESLIGGWRHESHWPTDRALPLRDPTPELWPSKVWTTTLPIVEVVKFLFLKEIDGVLYVDCHYREVSRISTFKN